MNAHTSDATVSDRLEAWQSQLLHTEWAQGNAAEAWGHVVDARDKGPEAGSIAELKEVADAFADHVTNGLPWQQARWQEYVNRAKAWHMNHTPKDSTTVLNRPETIFDHPGEEVTVGNLTARPVTSSHQLALAGQEMCNSLPYWTTLCADGRSLIYTLHRDGEDRIDAAMELARYPNHWQVQQVEGPQFRKSTPDQRAIADVVANLLNAQST